MGGDGPYDNGDGTVATFFVIIVGSSLILFGCVLVIAAILAVTVGLPGP